MVLRIPTPIDTNPITTDEIWVSPANRLDDPTDAVPAKVDKMMTGIAIALALCA
jgi:hypothetical protein